VAERTATGLQNWRDERQQSGDKPLDNRTPAQRDRDRILYSSAFRRLGGVTQVVAAKEEGHLFHNRLTHSLKVAQVARRLAEMLLTRARGDKQAARTIRRYGGLDPDVAEAAGLAHDLGHPPFGHIAELVLNEAIRAGGGPEDGFEGNAQTFRILTKLAAIDETIVGLNLTRATLNGVLKYPWGPAGRDKKYGVYSTESAEFEWTRKEVELSADERTLEAQVMDWADDIAYSVHDVEDFFRAGLIPMGTWRDPKDLREVFERLDGEWDVGLYGSKPTPYELNVASTEAIFIFALRPPFMGTRRERARLRSYTSRRIGTLVRATQLGRGGLDLDRSVRVQVELLKQLTYHYVVNNAALATQQHGQRKVIGELYQTYKTVLRSDDPDAIAVFPPRIKDEVKPVAGASGDETRAVRVVADVIAGMTEAQAIRVHQRLKAVDFGPLLDPAVL
jgi:dGTPase